jgi:hypothetical protein
MRCALIALAALTIATLRRTTSSEEKSPVDCTVRDGALYCSSLKNLVKTVSVTGSKLAQSPVMSW